MIGAWKTATIAKDATLSDVVDLGNSFGKLLVLVPTITSATVSVHISNESGGTYYPVQSFDADATGHFLHASTADTGGIALIFNLGGVQFVKIATGAGQGAARSILVRGIDL